MILTDVLTLKEEEFINFLIDGLATFETSLLSQPDALNVVLPDKRNIHIRPIDGHSYSDRWWPSEIKITDPTGTTILSMKKETEARFFCKAVPGSHRFKELYSLVYNELRKHKAVELDNYIT